jgi:hypothetical protein
MSQPTRTGKRLGRLLLGERGAARLREASESAQIRGRWLGTVDGRRSHRLLSECRNEFRGQRAVIIGNGPSLRDTDLTLLKGEVTFGLNRVYLMFEELGFATTFLVAINELLISQVAPDLARLRCRKFIRWSCRGLFDQKTDNLAFLQSRSRTDFGFSSDPRAGIWEGATVTYVAMQLAFHMGFSKVVLVGVDHNFLTQGPPNATVESSGSDPNHFHAAYFGRGFRWQLPDLKTSEIAYRRARETYELDGRRIVDATVGGKLRVFPRTTLDRALHV